MPRDAKDQPAKNPSGISPRTQQWLERMLELIGRKELDSVEALLALVPVEAEGRPELDFVRGVLALRRGRLEDAIDFLQAVPDRASPEVPASLALAEAFERSGRHADAKAALVKAAEMAETAQQWLSVGVEADRQGYHHMALAAAEGALESNPASGRARLLHGRSAQILGKIDLSAADYRAATAVPATAAEAWFALTDLKTVRLQPIEIERLAKFARQPELTNYQQILTGFALGRAHEEAGRHARAFETYQRANQRVRMQLPWDAGAFSRQVNRIQQSFSSVALPDESARGREVIFIVGLPRSGTTLIEQTLAAHRDVEGASELPYLNLVLARESNHRRSPFPEWVTHATSEDWRRLGNEYLAMSARWRMDRPISTDKLPENWPFVGAALAMLPGARIIDCRRDPVETCWSCYKQLFAPGRAGFAYGFETLAAYWRDQVRLGDAWAARFPNRVRVQQHENFLSDPEGETRRLLAFCGLEFDPACLRFSHVQRAVRSASAAQIKIGLMSDTRRTTAFGSLLDPLRALLT